MQGQDIAAGKSLYKQKCTACHTLDRKVIGPPLADINERFTKEWLYEWIRNSQALIKKEDPYAVQIFQEYNQSVMTAFPELSNEDIDNILAYIDDAKNKPQIAGTGGQGSTIASSQNYTIGDIWIIIGILILVYLLYILLSKTDKMIQIMVAKKTGEAIEVETKSSIFKFQGGWKKWLLGHKKLVFFTFIFFLLLFTGWAFEKMWYTGVTQGYQPTQPIAFSHELHAGLYKIECQHCHSGAWKSKIAGIPSVNVCMNCHNYVQAREKNGGEISPEIMKIYQALDYDPETQKYGDNPKPIEWIKIHQLPEFSYFNHSQHVAVGGIACQTCHGPVETMEKVFQHETLTMRWCIDCHREQNIDYAKNNAYYSKVLQIHDALKKGEQPTVAILGGLECSKCHY